LHQSKQYQQSSRETYSSQILESTHQFAMCIATANIKFDGSTCSWSRI